VRYGEHRAARVSRCDHLLALSNGVCHRLLHDHVQPAAKCRDRAGGVRAIRRHQHNAVNQVGISRFNRAKGVGCANASGGGCGARRIAADHRGECGTFRTRECWRDPFECEVARPNKSPAD
jgi:hypothetical protein